MGYYIAKIAVTVILVVLVSEIARRSTFFGALLASIPLVSLLAIIWLYVETKDIARISALSTSIFWLVLPSLALFISLPLLLKNGVAFVPGLAIAVGITLLCYAAMVVFLGQFGVKL